MDEPHNLTIDTCYFQGQNNQAHAVQFQAGGNAGADIRNCLFNNYTGAAIDLVDGEDVDIHRPSHRLENTPSLVNDGAVRTRTDGVILEQDLSNVTGQFPGDEGMDNGNNTTGSGLKCYWTGSSWQPSDGSATF